MSQPVKPTKSFRYIPGVLTLGVLVWIALYAIWASR